MIGFLGDMLTRMGAALVPRMDANPTQQYFWRVRVAVAACSSLAGVMLITTGAFGFVPGFGGFVQESKFDRLIEDLRKNRADRLSVDLLNLRVTHCHAGTDESRRLYWQNISRLLDQYRETTGTAYILPNCSDL